MRPALLCETVTGETMAELLTARDAVTGADMVELRLDGVRGLDVATALHGRRLPAIVTCRPVWEGGRFDGDEQARHGILARAFDCGAEYVDVEWRAGFADLLAEHGPRVVISSHDFDGMPRDLDARARAMRAAGATVIKVAVAVARLAETLPLRAIAQEGSAVVIGMGEAGLPTRLLASRYGSRWTYAGRGAAPGQMPAARMIGDFRFRSVGAETRLYGVVGDEAARSPRPAMFNAAFGTTGLDAVCVPLRVADFGDFLAFADAFGLAGAGLAGAFERDALRIATTADHHARELGAADTLRRGAAGWEAMHGGTPERQFAWWTGHLPPPGVFNGTGH